MSYVAETSSYLSNLRERATAQLTNGNRIEPARISASEAMAVLFKLASSPSTAYDALALLHELQVHQVEVDMQHEELRQSRFALENDLIRQLSHIECAPAGFLVVDENTVLSETNPAGARLLGNASNDLLGRPLANFLSASSGERLKKMLAQVRNGAESETCELQLLLQRGAIQKLLCTASMERSSGRYLLVLLAPPPPN